MWNNNNNPNGSIYDYQGKNNFGRNRSPKGFKNNNFGNRNNNWNQDENKKKKIAVLLLLFLLFLSIVITTIVLLTTNGGSHPPTPPIPPYVDPGYAPTDLHSTNVTEDEIDIEFIAPTDAESWDDINHYNIDISVKDDFSALTGSYETTDKNETTYNITELSGATDYFIRVSSILDDGGSSDYVDLSERTVSSTPAPTNLKSTGVTKNKISIEFDFADPIYDIDHYTIQISKKQDFLSFDLYDVDKNVNKSDIINLNNDTNYYIRIYSVNYNGEHSSYSNVIQERTEKSGIPAPSNLSATNITSTEIDIKFDKSSGPGSELIKFYGIEVSKDSSFSDPDQYQISSESNEYSISGLKSSTYYFIRVNALASGGDVSSYSNVIGVQTLEKGEGPNLPDIRPRKDVWQSKWNYGSGKNWDDKVYAPFVDMVATTPPSLSEYHEQMGANYFNLGFVQTTTSSEALNPDGTIPWSWGGYGSLTEEGGSEQYQKMKSSIRDLRNNYGGDITISFGGAAGTPFWNNDFATVDSLEKTYELIVNGMGLSRIDFDIEATGVDLEENEINAKAVKKLQDKTGVQVVMTLPILEEGLVDPGITILKEYMDAGVDIEKVNVMSMCFQRDLGVPGDLDDIIMSLESLKDQLQTYWKSELGIDLTDEQAYNLEGVTPSIGFENKSNPPLLADEWKGVAQFAEEHNVGMLSDWVENRDALDDSYKDAQLNNEGGIKNKWEYGNIGRDNYTDEDFEKVEPPKPNPINGFKLDSKTFNTSNFSWNDDQPNGIDTRVYFAKDGDEEYELIDSLNDQDSYEVEYLEPDQSYWILLASVNSNNDKFFSDPIKFKTDSLPVDTEPPKWSGGETINIIDELSSYNRVAFDFDQATDNTGVKKYVTELLNDSGDVIDTKEYVNGVDFFDDDPSIESNFDNLDINKTYKLNVNAYDYNDNKSADITISYETGGYPEFDYDKSQDDFYKLDDIVRFTSTDPDWIAAGIGEQLYQKTGGWGGWAPDGSTTGSPESTDYEPGETRPGSTGWDHKTTISSNKNIFNIKIKDRFSNEWFLNKNYNRGKINLINKNK